METSRRPIVLPRSGERPSRLLHDTRSGDFLLDGPLGLISHISAAHPSLAEGLFQLFNELYWAQTSRAFDDPRLDFPIPKSQKDDNP